MCADLQHGGLRAAHRGAALESVWPRCTASRTSSWSTGSPAPPRGAEREACVDLRPEETVGFSSPIVRPMHRAAAVSFAAWAATIECETKPSGVEAGPLTNDSW